MTIRSDCRQTPPQSVLPLLRVRGSGLSGLLVVAIPASRDYSVGYPAKLAGLTPFASHVAGGSTPLKAASPVESVGHPGLSEVLPCRIRPTGRAAMRQPVQPSRQWVPASQPGGTDRVLRRVSGPGLSFVFTDYFACLRKRRDRVQWGAIGGASAEQAADVTTKFHLSHCDNYPVTWNLSSVASGNRDEFVWTQRPHSISFKMRRVSCVPSPVALRSRQPH